MTNTSLTINGTKYNLNGIPDNLSMVDYLNDILGLTGTKFSCGIGVCHACVVIVDEPDGNTTTMRTCINGAKSFAGKSVRTIESHAVDGKLSPVQQAFVDNFAFQCGYCTSGFVNAGTALVEKLAKEPVTKDQVEQAVLDGLGEHICRCTGYIRYYEALRDYILSTPNLTREG